MRSRLRWVVATVVVAWVILQWRRQTERRELLRLRDEVVQARGVAIDCTRSLVVEEAEFRDLAARVDSFRTVVERLEALDPRGVPVRYYEQYLATVDAYNEGVDRWGAVAGSLKASETACRIRVNAYNTLADSARGTPLGDPGGR